MQTFALVSVVNYDMKTCSNVNKDLIILKTGTDKKIWITFCILQQWPLFKFLVENEVCGAKEKSANNFAVMSQIILIFKI